MAVDWWTKTLTRKEDHGLKEVLCLWYPNVGSNNNDLPETLYFWDGNPEEANADAILEGFPPSKLKDKAEKLEARKAELAEKLTNAKEPPPLLHPNMASLYAQRIGQLYEHLQDADGRTQAAEAFRSLVDQVTLVPDNGELAIVLRGDLGAILRFAAGRKNPETTPKESATP